jgi:hypothetical protein
MVRFVSIKMLFLQKNLVIYELVELGADLIHYWSLDEILFLAGFAGMGFPNKDPAIWLDGRSPQKSYYEFDRFTIQRAQTQLG